MPDGVSGRPVWLLDFDGVLNAIARKPDPSAWPRELWVTGTAEVDGVAWPVLAARPVLAFVREVHVAGLAEIRWHSTWQQHADAVIRPLLELPAFPVQPSPEHGLGRAYEGWWKLPAAERVLHEEKRPLLWTDDDIRSERTRPGRGLGAVEGAERALLISPRANIGLTPKHLRQIREFLDGSPRLHEPASEDGPFTERA